jgi:alpha-galactosidase
MKGKIKISVLMMLLASQIVFGQSKIFTGTYDAILPKDKTLAILTPAPSEQPRINGADIFGAYPGNPFFFKVAATGIIPITYFAKDLPKGLSINNETGIISGKTPLVKGEYSVTITVKNAKGSESEELLIVVGDKLALSPIIGWSSWYTYGIHVSDSLLRATADAMVKNNLHNYGWTYINVDNGWQAAERNPENKALQGNEKFPDMKALTGYMHQSGLKFGLYSSLWMSCFRGYMGGTSPNEELDYSEYVIPMDERETPNTLFGSNKHRFKFSASSTVGPVWLVDIDAKQMADWDVDFMKYDWTDRTYEKEENGQYKREANGQLIEYVPDGIDAYKEEQNVKRLVEDYRSVERDIFISSSPVHNSRQDAMMANYVHLWRITKDIKAQWSYVDAALGAELHKRIYDNTSAGHYADLDMLQIGTTYKGTTPLTIAEQYSMVSLWALLSQPFLLSCDLTILDDFTRSLMTNYEVIDINQDRLCKPADRLVLDAGRKLQLYKKPLSNGQISVGLFNVADKKQDISFSLEHLNLDGKWKIRDVWRQQDIGTVTDTFTATLDGHGSLLLVLEKE